MTPLDGNALAGVLRELFCVEMTTAIGRCDSCGSTNALARTHVYTESPGIVVRCPDCEEVVMRMVRRDGHAWLDFRGISYLEVTLPSG